MQATSAFHPLRPFPRTSAFDPLRSFAIVCEHNVMLALNFALLFATGSNSPSSAHQLREHARTAIEELDRCLIDQGGKLSRSVDGYRTFWLSCGNQRDKAVTAALRWEWANSPPVRAEERQRAFRRALVRVTSRYEIWAVRILDPLPPTD